MAQPSTQQLLAAGHTTEYFWYAQGAGIFDARNNAMLAKTGSANTATEGGALVALANGSTTYALAAAISQSQPWTLIFKARVDSTAGTDGMPMGDPTTANDFVRMQMDSGTLSIRVASSSTASVTATLTTMTTWAFVSSGALISIYKDGVAQGSPQPINAAPLIISKLFDGYAGGGFVFKGALEFVNVVPSALDATAIAARFADPYSVLTSGGPAPHLIGIANSQQVIQASPVGIVSSAVSGTITLPACRQWETGNLRTSESGVVVIVNNPTTGALVVNKTGLTTHATTGECVVTDPAIVTGTNYRVTQILPDGSEGTWRYTAT